MLAGVGGAGVALVGWSRARNLREINYVVLDNDHGSLAASRVARQIKLDAPRSVSLGGNIGTMQRQAFARQASGADICIIVAGAGGRTGGPGAVALARIARRAGARVMAVVIGTALAEPEATQHRGDRMVGELAANSDIIFMTSLARMNLETCDADEEARRAEDLYEWVDRVIDIATAPAEVNLVLRAVALASPGEPVLGTFLRLLLPDRDLTKVAGRVAREAGLLPDQLANARDVTIIVRSEQALARTGAAVVAQIASLIPKDAAIDFVARPSRLGADRFGVDVVGFCPSPPDLGRRFGEMAWMDWTPLLPWKDREPAPITTSYRGLFGSRFEPSAPAGDVVRSGAAMQVADKWRALKADADFAEGGVMAWLDAALSEVAVWLAGAWRFAVSAPRRVRGAGAVASLHAVAKTPMKIVRYWRDPENSSPLRDWRTLAAVVAVIIAPVAIAGSGIANLAAIGRANTLLSVNDRYGETVDIMSKFAERDRKRLNAAASATPVTAKSYEALWPARLPSATAAQMDLFAASSTYLSLEQFPGSVSPFEFVNNSGQHASGQLRIVAEFAGRSQSQIQALNALGFFPSVTTLARLTGGTPELLAGDADQLYKPDGKLDIDEAVEMAGCPAVSDAIKQRFILKRLAPGAVELPYAMYVARLATLGTGDCDAKLARAKGALDTLEAFKAIRYLRTTEGPEAAPTKISYLVVAERDVLAPEDRSSALALYLSGIRAFYLLDFARAEALFVALSESRDPIASALGFSLTGRTIFWRHEFGRGSYRPDSFPPWRNLEGEDYQSEGDEDEAESAAEEAAKLPRCAKSGDKDETRCLSATITVPPAERGASLDAESAERLRSIKKRLDRLPFVNPRYLQIYLGDSADSLGEDR